MKIIFARPLLHLFFFHIQGIIEFRYPSFRWKYNWDSHWIIGRSLLTICYDKDYWWFRLFGTWYGLIWRERTLSYLRPCSWKYIAMFMAATCPKNTVQILPIIYKR